MTIGCNIWMICLKLNRFFYCLSRMLHLSEFLWTLRSSVLVAFNNFLIIDATDKSKISSDQKRFFIELSLYPLSFFANTPCKDDIIWCTNPPKNHSDRDNLTLSKSNCLSYFMKPSLDAYFLLLFMQKNMPRK